jgi:zinc-ribbon domain
MLKTGKCWCCVVLLSMVACLYGCIEAEERIRVHEDGSFGVKVIMKIDPQYEALVLPALKEELMKKLPSGARIDFSQRIDGKAAILIEADGAAAAKMLKEDGSAAITVSDGGFWKKRYEYRETVKLTPEIPFMRRTVVSLPGSIESFTGGNKTAGNTVEFDQTHAKRGDVFAATSTAFAFSMRSSDTEAASMAYLGPAAWLTPASIGSICVGIVLLLIDWFRSRQTTHSRAAPQPVVSSAPVTPQPPLAKDARVVFCSQCGARNALGRKFCNQCGHDLG